ncbi:MAG: hypothetical protein V4629_05255 [Pseudomonadota bacterium]
MSSINQLTKQYKLVDTRVNKLSLRERTILFLIINILLFLIFFVGLNERISLMRKQAILEAAEARDSALILQSDFAVMQVEYSLDPDVEKKKKLKLLGRSIDDVKDKITKQASVLIPPTMMVKVLQDVFKNQQEVRFYHLKKLPLNVVSINKDEDKPITVSVISPLNNQNISAANNSQDVNTIAKNDLEVGKIYLHGVELAFEANYIDTIEYLKKLESLPWKIIWESIEYEVINHPNALVKVHLRTLSYDESWLGV